MSDDPLVGGEREAALQRPLVDIDWPQPDWQSEKGQPTRALWRIAVMAGNLKPDKAIRDRRIKADKSWERDYSLLVNAMKDALSSDPAHTEHIYFNPEHSGNANRLERPTRLLEISVDMLSALNFIERRLGPENMPAGMLEVLRFKQSNSPQPSGVDVVRKNQSGRAALKPAEKDQVASNEKKACDRLRALLFATLLWEAFKQPAQGREELVQEEIIENLKEIVKDYGLDRVHGFGKHGFKTLTKDLADSYYHILSLSKKDED